MGADIPFLLAHGGLIGLALLVVTALAGATLGPGLAAWFARSARDRRLRSLGTPATLAEASRANEIVLSGTLLPARAPTQRHLDARNVVASVAARRGRQDQRRARRAALQTDGGVVLLRGPIAIDYGSENSLTRDATIATSVLQRYVPRVFLPTSVRSVAPGDRVTLRGRVVKVKHCKDQRVAVLESAVIVHTGPIESVRTPRRRVRHAFVAAIAVLAFGTALGYGGVWLGTKSPTFRLRWTGVLAAAMTPLRSRALAAAEELAALELVAAFPENTQQLQYYRTRSGLGHPEAARYLALSRLRQDCEHAPDRLTSFAVLHADLTEPAAERLLECKRPLDIIKVAEARFWESDFAGSSTMFDQAAVVWGETDKDQLYSSNLVIYRAKKEIFAHWLAGRFDAAGRTLDRIREEDRTPSLECVRHVMGVMANAPNALAKLREQEAKCPIHLASVDADKRLGLIDAHKELAHREYLYQAWTMELEPLLAANVKYRAASGGSSVARLETPHELLAFPHGTRDLEPALVAELLKRVERDPKPTPARRLLRARLASIAATFESLWAEHGAARRLIVLARGDYAALVALPISKDETGPSSYEHDQLELESRHAGVLNAAIELQAGEVEQAARISDAIPALVVTAEQTWLDSDAEDLKASTELIRAFIELFRGRPQRMQGFAGSKLCDELSGCFIVRGNLEALVRAARGNADGCDENVCLVAARQPAARAKLIERLDDFAGSAAVTENPLDRLYRIGQARRLAQALRDPERLARFDRWFAAVRPIALDPRLAVARRTLEHVN